MIFRSVLIVALTVVVVVVVVVRPSDDDGGATSTDDVASPTGPTPPFGLGPITAGLHDFAIFDPRLSLVFGDGWSAVLPPDNDEIALDGPVFLAISRPSMVVDPDSGAFVPLPDDIIAWVGTHKDLDSDDPVATTLGGRPGFMIDATAREGTKIFGFNTVDAILITRGDRMRLIVADVDGKSVTALMIASPAEFEAKVATGQALLDTLRFEEGV